MDQPDAHTAAVAAILAHLISEVSAARNQTREQQAFWYAKFSADVSKTLASLRPAGATEPDAQAYAGRAQALWKWVLQLGEF